MVKVLDLLFLLCFREVWCLFGKNVHNRLCSFWFQFTFHCVLELKNREYVGTENKQNT
jgi:hypothetical protein